MCAFIFDFISMLKIWRVLPALRAMTFDLGFMIAESAEDKTRKRWREGERRRRRRRKAEERWRRKKEKDEGSRKEG